jgi:lipopolysaccharide/colanic/teichoic acid biosynthesis glycosyltransferase
MAGKSEVANLMQQIQVEYEAAQSGISGYAQVTTHASIEARERNIDGLRNQLVTLIGDEEATAMIFHQVYNT